MGHCEFSSYHIDMIFRVLNLVESVLLKHFTKNEGKWANFMAIVLGYFPQFVVCI